MYCAVLCSWMLLLWGLQIFSFLLLVLSVILTEIQNFRCASSSAWHIYDLSVSVRVATRNSGQILTRGVLIFIYAFSLWGAVFTIYVSVRVYVCLNVCATTTNL